ncbi:MAG: hypothetical protein ACOYXT_23500 [Bacteroidota bacterium]
MSPQTRTTEKREFTLKPLSKEGVEAALAKAERYRLLNQPMLAESICQDILLVEPQNQKAAVVLLLSLTDQFKQSSSKASKQAKELANSLKDEYERVYYTGIILERLGSIALNSGAHGSDFDAYEWYLEAMEQYERADAVNKDSKNDDPILRWNTCARIITQHNLKERPFDDLQPTLE